MISYIFRILRLTTAFAFFIFTMVLVFAFSLLTWRRYSEVISGPALRLWGKISLKILGIKLITHGEWPFSERIPRLVIVNHLSTLDIVWAATVCPNAFSCIGKRELRWVFPFNIGWWSFRLYYIDRKDRESAITTLKQAARDMVESNRTVMMAPEGTRSPDGRMLPFKKGAFHFAISEHLPICPMVAAGVSELMPKGTLIPKPGVLHVEFMEPISTQAWQEGQLDEHISEVRSKMEKTYLALRVKANLPEL